MLRGAPALLLLALATPATAAEPTTVLVCNGHEPEWSLRIDGSAATLATLDARGLRQTGLAGRLGEAGGRVPSFVYRGRVGTSGADLVAVITKEACADTMADAAEGGGLADYAARLSLPDGEIRLGCCSIPAAIAPSSEASLPGTPPAESQPSLGAPAPASAAAPAGRPDATSVLPAAGGEVVALALPDGRVCRRTGKRDTPTFQGHRVNFDCGRSGGDMVGLVGALAFGPEGLLTAQKALIEWRESGMSAPRPIEATPAQVAEVALSDALTCRHVGKGATLAFEGRRVNYTCGLMDGETVALVGDPEPIEGGFRIVRARIALGEAGFVLRSSETIVVAGPR